MEKGTLLVGRYRLEERVRTGADGSLWRAVDETLDRQVSVRVVRPGHEHTAEVVDAARRATLVEDDRLIRVLDVGTSEGSAFIVAEHLVGSTLAELIADGPLAAGTARHLVGEAAQALDRASARGLHHLLLRPESLVVAAHGRIKVTGTAVEAALAGVEPAKGSAAAERTDAVGLVRLLYAALTGQWPGAEAIPPGDLVTGVPNDLDTLCTVTLGPHDDGPRSPAELAEQLAPWDASGPSGHAVAPARREAAARGTARAASAPASAPSAGPATRSATLPAGSDTLVETAHDPGPRSGTGSGARPGDDGPDDWSLLSRPAAVPAPPAETDVEPLGPFIPPAPLARPPQDQTRFVLGLVAGLVVLGLVLAMFSLRGIFGSSDPLVQPEPLIPTASPAHSAAAAPAPSSAPAAGASNLPTAGTPGESSGSPSGSAAEVSGIQAIDPQGDGDENGSTADHAIDGDPSTTWRSARYQSPQFGGLKQGLGLFLQVAGGPITSVRVDMAGTGGTVELRTANGPGLDSSVVVATATASGGKAMLTPTTPLPGGPLLLWFTGLPQQDGGEYRLVVSEITVA